VYLRQSRVDVVDLEGVDVGDVLVVDFRRACGGDVIYW